jgi:hypothetical protein
MDVQEWKTCIEWTFAYEGGRRAISGHTIPTNSDKVIMISRQEWSRVPKNFPEDVPRSLLVNLPFAKVLLIMISDAHPVN